MNPKPIRTHVSILFNHKDYKGLKNQFLSISNGIKKSYIQKLQAHKNYIFSLIYIFFDNHPLLDRIQSKRNLRLHLGSRRIQPD